MVTKSSARGQGVADTRAVKDVDLMGSVMRDGVEGEYVQLEAKRFAVRWTTLRLGPIVLQFALEEIAVVRRIRFPSDRWGIIIPIDVGSSARWNGRPAHPHDVVVSPPGSECFSFDPGGTRFVILTASPSSTFAAAAQSVVGRDRVNPTTAVWGPDVAILRDELDRLRLCAESDRVTSIEPAAEGAAIDFAVSQCLCRSHPGAAPTASRSDIVSRAEEFLRTHAGEGVSIAQLSLVTGVSERSLRNAFYDVYTTSPKRYMKLWQLHQVRHALRDGNRHHQTVTDAATNHGCYELGRFAGEYRTLFGETPSETLSRARQRQVVGGAA